MSAGGRQRRYTDNVYHGVYYGTVIANDDSVEAGAPGSRVLVNFPWLPDYESDKSYWAHLMVPMIGHTEGEAGYGTYTCPEVKDQVLVVFIAGDIRQPVIIGGVWSKKDAPPETNEHESNDYRLIKSRSGHRLILDDSDKVKINLTDYKNTNGMIVGQFELGGSDSPNATEATPPGPMGSSEAKEGVNIQALESGSTFNVWCPAGELLLDAGMDVEISASQTLEVKGGTSIEISSPDVKIASKITSDYDGEPIKIGQG